MEWSRDIIDKYDIDGFRIDTIPHVPKWFWDKFTEATGVFSVGEVFNGDIGYLAGYQGHVPSLLNYPIWFAGNGIFGHGDSMYKIREVFQNEHEQF